MIFDSSSGETTSHGEILLSNLIFVAGIRAAINGNSINLKQTRVTDVRNDVLSKERGDERSSGKQCACSKKKALLRFPSLEA